MSCAHCTASPTSAVHDHESRHFQHEFEEAAVASPEPVRQEEGPKRRGGSKKGRKYQKIPRTADDPLVKVSVWMRAKDKRHLEEQLGGVSRGIQELITADRRAWEDRHSK